MGLVLNTLCHARVTLFPACPLLGISAVESMERVMGIKHSDINNCACFDYRV